MANPIKGRIKSKRKKINPNQALMEEISEDKEAFLKKGFFKYLNEKRKLGEYSFFQEGMGGLIDEFRNFNNNKDKIMEKYIAYETVVDCARDTMEFYILIILSCLIATFGLYQNSPAVIIGAMIVAPLMGPILGFSAGVLWGSLTVLWEAITTLIKGIVVVIGITSLLTFIVPGITIGKGTQTLIRK